MSSLIDSKGKFVQTWVGVMDFQGKEVNDLINTVLSESF